MQMTVMSGDWAHYDKSFALQGAISALIHRRVGFSCGRVGDDVALFDN